MRERSRQLDVIQQTFAEPGGGIGILGGDVLVDLKEVVPGPRGNNYFEHRLTSSWRTSSSGMPWPASS